MTSTPILFFVPQEKSVGARNNGKNTNFQKKNFDDNKNGYVSAMFRNNPQVSVDILNKKVDNLAVVNKNKNSLFSTSTYKELTDLHAHMVGTLNKHSL